MRAIAQKGKLHLLPRRFDVPVDVVDIRETKIKAFENTLHCGKEGTMGVAATRRCYGSIALRKCGT